MEIEVLNISTVHNLPSASGIAKLENTFYMIGDDSPFLFLLNKNGEIVSKSSIHSTQELLKGRIPKDKKPDFEALEIVNKKEIVVFGSGSKPPERDVFVRILLKDTLSINSYCISSFYSKLRKFKILENEELNIEAVAFHNEQVYLFNRGKNIIFSFIYKDLIKYFKDLAPFPEPKTTLFDLPKIKGIEAGFSGATILNRKPLIIFTASVENTNNAYNDGEILGSFIGIINLSNNVVSTSYRSVAIPFQVKPIKVESVTIESEITSRKTRVVLVTDDDEGNSMKIDCQIMY